MIAFAQAIPQDDSANRGRCMWEIAKSQIHNIDHRHGDIHIDSDTIFKVLQQPENIVRSHREILDELQKPLSILLVLAGPKEQPHLRLLEEKRALQKALKCTKFRG